MSYILYGIPNCDTIKKARKYLTENHIDYVFHNYKKDGIQESKILSWIDQQPTTVLVNKNGTTFRKLSDEDKLKVNDVPFVVQLMQEQPSIIKRPILEKNNAIVAVGFKPEKYSNLLAL